jgi:uncharacterized protein DUF4242
MKKYVIEREIPGIGASTPAQLCGAAETSCEALARLAPDIQWVHSYVVRDRTFCLYLARDEAMIRRHAELSGFPATRIHEVCSVFDPSAATSLVARAAPARRGGVTKLLGLALAPLLAAFFASCRADERLMLDVHHVEKGTRLEDVAQAHRKDLAVQGSHGVEYQRYWVDESSGTIFCLVAAPSAAAATEVHREAHGLVADEVREVVPGILPARASGSAPLFMDTHRVAPGVRPEDVADAHRKDLAAQGAHGVRFLNYWVDERGGTIHCLAEAPNAEAVLETHREAHGLLPETVLPVVEGH